MLWFDPQFLGEIGIWSCLRIFLHNNNFISESNNCDGSATISSFKPLWNYCGLCHATPRAELPQPFLSDVRKKISEMSSEEEQEAELMLLDQQFDHENHAIFTAEHDRSGIMNCG